MPEHIPTFRKDCKAEFWINGMLMNPRVIRAPAAIKDAGAPTEAAKDVHNCGDEEAQALAKELERRMTAAKDRPEDPEVA